MNVRAKRLIWFLINIFLLTLLPACGGGGGGSSSAPTPIPVSVSVSPGQATVTVSATQQFTATVSGSSAGVSWSVNDVPSGNAMLGTITAAGLYTAPDVPPSPNNSVTVKATSSADSTKSATARVAVENPAPQPTQTTTDVSQITAGTSQDVTITVQGSGFTVQSKVMASYAAWASNPVKLAATRGAAQASPTALATTFVSSTVLTAVLPADWMTTGGYITLSVETPPPGGGTTTAGTLTINNPAPVITSLLTSAVPALAGNAFTLTINGSGFVPSSTVLWNGGTHAATWVNSNKMTVSVMAGEIPAATSVAVKVSNPTPAGGESSLATFQVENPAPSVSGIDPISKDVGGTSFALTVNGSNFVSTSTVEWCNPATPPCSSLTPTSWTSNKLIVTVPASYIAATSTAITVTVVNPTPGGGTFTPALGFSVVNPAPVIQGLSRTSATVGETTFTKLTISGSGFLGDSAVWWGTTKLNATLAGSNLEADIVPAVQLAAAGTVTVTVVNPSPGGGTSNAKTFTVNNLQPAISSTTPFSPANATAGGAAFTLTVNGSDFVGGVNHATVQWCTSPTSCTPRDTAFVSSSQLQASIFNTDIATAGKAYIAVVNPDPSVGPSAQVEFDINNPVPTVTSLDPSIVEVGVSATLHVYGTGFVTGAAVQWNGAALPNHTTELVSPTELRLALSASDLTSTGTANISVLNPLPGGGPSGTLPLTINNPLPTISGFSPPSATVGDSITLTVEGSNFVTGATVSWCTALLGCDPLQPTTANTSQLVVAIPPADTADGAIVTIKVTNPGPGGGTTIASQTFTLNNPAPMIQSLSASTAIVGDQPFNLTITGSGFVAGSKVNWASTNDQRTPVSQSSTELVVGVTSNDLQTAGAVSITVSNPDPGGQTSAPATFTIYAAPVISSLSPPSTTAPGSAFTLTVTGSNFVSGAQLYFGSNPTPYSTTVAANGASLTTAISSSDVQTPGTAQVKVVNVTAGGGVSNTDKYFAINSPVPTVISLVPNNHSAGSGDFPLIVNGTNFFSGAVVLFNGHSYTPDSVNATQITATISGSEILSTGMVPVTVQNPAPNSPLSGNLDFTINPGGGSLTTTFLLYPVNNGTSPVSTANVSVNNDYDCDTTTPQPDYLVNQTAIPSSCATTDKKDMAALALNVQPWDESGLSVQLSADHPSLVRVFDDQDRALSLSSPLTIDPISFYAGVPLQYHVEGLPGGNPGDSVQLTLTVNGTPTTKTLVVGKQVTINLTFDDGPDFNEGFNQTSSVLSGLTSYPIDGGGPIPATFFTQTNLPFHGGDPYIGGPLITAEATDHSMVGVHTGNGWDATCDPNYGDPLNQDPWACDHISHCVRVQYPPYQVTDANGNTVTADLTHTGTLNVNALESDLIQAEAQIKRLTSTTGNPITPTLVRPTYGGYPNDGYCECIQGLGYPSCTPTNLWNDPDYGVAVTYTRVTPNPLTKQLWDVDSGDTDACVDTNGNPVPDVLTCMQTQLTSAALGSYWGPGIQTLIDPPNNKTSIVVLMHDDVLSQIAADYINQLLKIIQKAVRYKGMNEVFGALGQ